MKLRLWALAGAAILFAGTAWADDPMANTYANTVTTKNHANGAVGALFFNSNMTYTGKATDAKGQPVQYTGKWMTKDDGKSICLTPDAPPNAPNPPKTSCSPLEMHKVGDSWVVTNDQKETYDVSLIAGR
jgi:hypothetical protein